MQLNVVNHVLAVGSIQITGVASASVLQIGDTEEITLISMFDTPPESVIVGPLAPLQEPEGASRAEGEPDVYKKETYENIDKLMHAVNT
ncbi:hypothetical protein [Paenibacillus montanisoli]|uniref:hypothetical protein n=1 Tax=Paenibacillus montanisoli TaxID=2081970 RepID=UPI001F0C94B6|nr:hypothetical protein [Paenibacillus montanisoli]